MNKTAKIAAAVIAASLFAFAFWAAPRSCEGGLEYYFWSGVAALPAMMLMPLVVPYEGTRGKRVAWAFGLLALGTVAWVGGFAAAPFRIMCRLF